MNHSTRALCTALLLTACSAPTETAPSEQTVDAIEAVSLDGWRSETIALPPQFAPSLPSGSETLLFAPGFFDPEAADFWTYAFVMWLDEPAPDAARLSEMFEAYYDGLISAVARSADRDVGNDPAQVELTTIAPGTMEGRIHLVDAFGTFEWVDLHLIIETAPAANGKSVVSIQASPQAGGHDLWRSLDAAVARLQDS